jgi:hypothetical protein
MKTLSSSTFIVIYRENASEIIQHLQSGDNKLFNFHEKMIDNLLTIWCDRRHIAIFSLAIKRERKNQWISFVRSYPKRIGRQPGSRRYGSSYRIGN